MQNLSNKLTEVNEAIKAFSDELKVMGLWNNVVGIFKLAILLVRSIPTAETVQVRKLIASIIISGSKSQ
jgi:hypothetical protein